MISIFLEDLLKKHGVSIRALSKRTGIPYSTMYELVHGKKALERAASETVLKISQALGVTMEEIVIGSMNDRKESQNEANG